MEIVGQQVIGMRKNGLPSGKHETTSGLAGRIAVAAGVAAW
jgi:hypothetical protein